MINNELLAVTSRSFSKHTMLRKRLQSHFANVKFNEQGTQLKGAELIDFLLGAKRAVIGLEIIDDQLLSALPDLKVICKMGTGVDKIDFGAINRHKVMFSHSPEVNKRSVSELVLGLIFTLFRHLKQANQIASMTTWKQIPGRLLSNKIVGIIGFGAIGQDLAKILKEFDCRCLVYDVIFNHLDAPSHVTFVDLDHLLRESDIVSLHIPLNAENYHILGMQELLKMKQDAILINTARGGLIDEEALYSILNSRGLAAAALDVFEFEPHISEKLLSLDNFYATPHIGGSTYEAIEAMGTVTIHNLLKTI